MLKIFDLFQPLLSFGFRRVRSTEILALLGLNFISTFDLLDHTNHLICTRLAYDSRMGWLLI